MNYGFLIRNDRCIGCHACSTACKSENDVPLGVNRTWVKNVERGAFPDVRRHFQVTRCNHCANPPCVRICPVTAMYRREDGIVEFDGDRCIGCKACLQACPYDAIYIDPESGTAAKCHYCAHRVEMSLEPACVVVCPEHAIVAGDLDDPDAEITRMLAEHSVTVRKPEQGTRPNLFYVDGDDDVLVPTATERAPVSFAWTDVVPLSPAAKPDGRTSGPLRIGSGRFASDLVRGVYNAQHRIPWHWPVAAYLVTKGMAAGAFLLLAAAWLTGWVRLPGALVLVGGLQVLLALGATTALLVLDLERPERFLRILTRPQWRSWLTRGGVVLVAFSTLAALWWAAEVAAALGRLGTELGPLRTAMFALGTPLAALTACYTAFLFGQAEGRDLWQSPLLPAHLLVQAILAGAATLAISTPALTLGAEVTSFLRSSLVTALVVDLLLLAGEYATRHASEDAARAAREIVRGRHRRAFWGGAILLGHVLPLALLAGSSPWAFAASGLAALGGLYAYERVFVEAPQEIPNS